MSAPPPPPTDAALARLDADSLAALLTAIRRAIRADAASGDEAQQLLQAPAARLVGRRGCRRVAAVLAAEPQLWAAVAGDREVARIVDGLLPDAAASEPEHEPDASAGAGDRGSTEREEAAKRRVRELREQRDAWRRRAAGADARATRLADELEVARGRIAELEQQLETLGAQLEEHEAQRDRAVERERRRRDAEVVRLEEQLATARSELEEQRQAAARRQASRPTSSGRGTRASTVAEQRPQEDEPGDDRFVPGRPSRLPTEVVAGTTEAASLLLHPGRKVLVDGYNVTRQHRDHLDLEGQRAWLVQLLATAAATRRIRPVVVFDGERAGGGRRGAGSREVEVRFTPAGITADDELVLDVEGTDEPVVLVTDDRELAGRAAASGADVIGTTVFLGAVSGAAR